MDSDLARNLDEKSGLVDQALERFLRQSPPVPNLHEGLLYALGLDQIDPAIRGKRIRPALCLITCETLGGNVEEALPFAMSVELMHNFFLVHDDIEDGDAYRRGRPSVWKKYGLAHGINIGDYLYTKVFEAFLLQNTLSPQLRIDLLKLLVETLDHTHVGQAQDINALACDSITLDQYLDIVTHKTGYYLAAPMIGGARIAHAEPQTLQAIRNLGRYVGPVFQIVDDTLDLTTGKGREAVGSDIREGKRSYLVAHTASNATETERAELFRILNLPREETTPEHIQTVQELFARYKAVEAGQTFCHQLMESARQAMTAAPAALRNTLMGIFDELLERKR
jgi:geranylgeranyl pyrophosphate synthase